MTNIAVVIPCYRAGSTLLDVVRAIEGGITHIYVIDDGCPERSADALDPGALSGRVTVLRNDSNLGVGGAVKRGYREALNDGADIIVKLDADGQMDPAQIPMLLAPLIAGTADYAKGNRFALAHRLPQHLGNPGRPMPPSRRLANNAASFLHKAVTGYWNIMDPANGFTAIRADALRTIDLAAVADRYFFETDMLFQLGLVDAVVTDVPLPAHYADERSNLRLRSVAGGFARLAANRFVRRIWAQYFIQDFNVASLELALALPLLSFGTMLGSFAWIRALESGVPATAGTVMFAALPIILGFQLLLSAISFDVARRPDKPISLAPAQPEIRHQAEPRRTAACGAQAESDFGA